MVFFLLKIILLSQPIIPNPDYRVARGTDITPGQIHSIAVYGNFT